MSRGQHAFVSNHYCLVVGSSRWEITFISATLKMCCRNDMGFFVTLFGVSLPCIASTQRLIGYCCWSSISSWVFLRVLSFVSICCCHFNLVLSSIIACIHYCIVVISMLMTSGLKWVRLASFLFSICMQRPKSSNLSALVEADITLLSWAKGLLRFGSALPQYEVLL